MTTDTPTPAALAAAAASIAAIARRCLGLTTLEPRNADALDFHACHVGRIALALTQAWFEGAAHAREHGLCARAQSPLALPPTEAPAPGLKRFHVTIEQPLLTLMTVDAPDEDDALDLARRRYEGEPIDFDACDFGTYEVLSVEEVAP